MTEDDIIELFYGAGAFAFGKLSDCGSVPLSREDKTKTLLLTTDSMSEDIHFRLDWSSAEDLAIKLYQSNLSDLCIGGAEPNFCLLNLGLPENIAEDFPLRFSRAFTTELKRDACRLVGGDTFRSKNLQLSLTLGGFAEREMKRSGGQVGDILYLSGFLGFSLAGYNHISQKRHLPELSLHSMPADLFSDYPDATAHSGIQSGKHSETNNLRSFAIERHLRPRARKTWARLLRELRDVHAGMDLSDGILQDALRLARASNVAIEIDMASLPIPEKLREWISMEEALISGEEYELLFLAPEGIAIPFPCTAIGRAAPCNTGPELILKHKGRVIPPPTGGFHHF